MTMNVYMLETTFASEALDQPKAIQKQVEDTLRSALASKGLTNEFRRVSQPYPDKNMAMAVVCSEEAATQLRQMGTDIGVASLSFDEGRTKNLQAVQHLMKR